MKEIKYECTKYILEEGDLHTDIARRAVNKYKDRFNYIDLDFIVYDFEHMLENLGFSDVKVYYSGFYSQGDGACFEADINLDDFSADKIKDILEEYPTDTELKDVLTNMCDNFCHITDLFIQIRKMNHIRYNHENTMDIYNAESGDNYNGDDLMFEEAETFLQYCKDLAFWFYSRLEAEYEYQDSYEYIFQMLVDNEYEFNEKGDMI